MHAHDRASSLSWISGKCRPELNHGGQFAALLIGAADGLAVASSTVNMSPPYTNLQGNGDVPLRLYLRTCYSFSGHAGQTPAYVPDPLAAKRSRRHWRAVVGDRRAFEAAVLRAWPCSASTARLGSRQTGEHPQGPSQGGRSLQERHVRANGAAYRGGTANISCGAGSGKPFCGRRSGPIAPSARCA